MSKALISALNAKGCFWIMVFFCFLGLSQFYSCASIRAPSGGPKDTIAPFVLGSIPRNYTRNFRGESITILFDEFIKLVDQQSAIQISPELEKPPLIKVVKKSILIDFKSPLEKNRTYTINFGNAIVDYNEGNILKNYRFVLSTGKFLDSLKITGQVSDPLDTSVKKNVLVIIHPIGNDSAILKKKPFLFTTTDEKGFFSLENLPAGNYNLYALQESNKNKIYDSKDESIAFFDHPIHLTKDTGGIQLRLFKEKDTTVKVLKKTIREGRASLYFNQPPDSLTIVPIQQKNGSGYILDRKENKDSVYIWMKNPQEDSLLLNIQYKQNKSVQVHLSNFNKPKKFRPFTTEDNIKQNLISPDQLIILTFSRPILKNPLDMITILEDSLKTHPDSLHVLDSSYRRYQVFYPWLLKKQYKIQIKEAAITDLFGGKNQEYDHAVIFGEERNYGTINLKLDVPHKATYVVQLLDDKFKMIQSRTIYESSTLNYKYILPGKYRIRVIYDKNKNGIYDTGNLLHKIQPEKIINSKEITIRPNFEINPSFPLSD